MKKCDAGCRWVHHGSDVRLHGLEDEEEGIGHVSASSSYLATCALYECDVGSCSRCTSRERQI